MTRKDYILIARAFRDMPQTRVFPEQMAYWLANTLEHDNPRFDYGHFIAMVKGEKALTSKTPRPTLKDRLANDSEQAVAVTTGPGGRRKRPLALHKNTLYTL